MKTASGQPCKFNIWSEFYPYTQLLSHCINTRGITIEQGIKGRLHYMNLNPIAFEPPITSHIRSQDIANINCEQERHHFIKNESGTLHFINNIIK